MSIQREANQEEAQTVRALTDGWRRRVIKMDGEVCTLSTGDMPQRLNGAYKVLPKHLRAVVDEEERKARELARGQAK